MAPMFRANLRPSAAPFAAASITFVCSTSIRTDSPSIVSGVSVSGIISLAISIAPGAAIKLAAMRYSNGAPRSEYPTRTQPATLAMPPTITVNSSERVIFST